MTATPYYTDDLVTLYHGDTLDVMRTLADQFDLVFTSPPYNLKATPWPALSGWDPSASRGSSKWMATNGDVEYDDHDDAIPWEQYVAWQHEVWRAMWDSLTDRGAVFYNHKPRVVGGRLWKPDELIPADLPVRQEVIWARAGGINYNATAYVPTHERIYIVARDRWRLRSKGAAGVGDVWRVPQSTGSEHPAPFPMALPARAIETTGANFVLDPFAGSGTTLLAAKRAGVRSVGIEKSERYCALAAERLGGPIRHVDGAFDFT